MVAINVCAHAVSAQQTVISGSGYMGNYAPSEK